MIASKKAKHDILGDNQLQVKNRPAYRPNIPIPKVEEVIGRALDSIGTYNDLDNKYVLYFPGICSRDHIVRGRRCGTYAQETDWFD